MSGGGDSAGAVVGWAIVIAVIFLIALVIQTIIHFAPVSYILILTAVLLGAWYWGNKWYENLDSTKQRKWQEEAAVEAARRASEIAIARAKYHAANFPDVDAFELSLAKGYADVMREIGDPLILKSDHAARIIRVFGKLYAEQFPAFPDDDALVDEYLERKAKHAKEALALYWRSSVTALAQFTQAMPPELKRSLGAEEERGMFELPTRTILLEDNTDEPNLKWPIRTAFQTLDAPFHEAQGTFIEYGFEWKEMYPWLPSPHRRTDYSSDTEYRRADKQNDEVREEIITSLAPEQSAFLGTAFFRYAREIFPDPGDTLPFNLPVEARRAHTMIVAGSDRGKTQTLERMIACDLLQEDPPGMVVIDSKSDMVKRLSRLNVFNPDTRPLKDRLILIDPREAPALNPFAVLPPNFYKLDTDVQEELFTQVSTNLFSFFEALMAEDMSTQMTMMLNPLLQLMLCVPGATLETLIDAIDNPAHYSQHFGRLTPMVRRLLIEDYSKIALKETKNAVKRRLYGMGSVSPTFERMFTAKSNRVDMVRALNEGKVVLVSTEANFLGKLSPVFGRFFISLAYSAALSRASIQNEDDRRQAYLYIDEAKPYFDASTENLFTTLRSYRLGVIAAFQNWDQAPPPLRSAMLGSTNVKLVGGGNYEDATTLAKSLNTTPEFIANQPFKNRKYTHWACHIRNSTPQAISLRAPFGTVDKIPHMSKDQYTRMRARNRLALGDDPSLPEQSAEHRTYSDEEVEILPPQKTLRRRKDDAEDIDDFRPSQK